MENLGGPISYKVVCPGTSILADDRSRVGKLKHVLAAEDLDILDGLIIELDSGHNRTRFVDAPEIAEIFENGVLLSLAPRAVSELPAPTQNPAVIRDDPADEETDPLKGKLARAWELISGNY